MELIALYVHPQNSKHLRSHSRAIMALDHSRLGLENKFLENKSGRIFLRSTGLLYKFLPTNLRVCKPTFYTFYTSHLRWNNTIYPTDPGQNAVFHNFWQGWWSSAKNIINLTNGLSNGCAVQCIMRCPYTSKVSGSPPAGWDFFLFFEVVLFCFFF